jgi:cell division initiation protein
MDAGTIIGKTFSKRMMGIDPDEVEFFLREVAEFIKQLEKQRDQFERRALDLEQSLHATTSPVVASSSPTDSEKDATAELLERARRESERIVRDAEQKAADLVDQARLELSRLKESIIIMQAKRESIATRLKMLLQSEIELIRSLESDNDRVVQPSSQNDEERALRLSEIEEIIKHMDGEQ